MNAVGILQDLRVLPKHEAEFVTGFPPPRQESPAPAVTHLGDWIGRSDGKVLLGTVFVDFKIAN